MFIRDLWLSYCIVRRFELRMSLKRFEKMGNSVDQMAIAVIVFLLTRARLQRLVAPGGTMREINLNSSTESLSSLDASSFQQLTRE